MNEEDKLVVDFVKVIDGAVCPACAYDLRGICSAQCPECGEQLYVSTIIGGQYRRFLLMGIALGVGIGGLVIQAVGSTLMMSHDSRYMQSLHALRAVVSVIFLVIFVQFARASFVSLRAFRVRSIAIFLIVSTLLPWLLFVLIW